MSERNFVIVGKVAEKPVHLELNDYIVRVIPFNRKEMVEAIVAGYRLDERVETGMVITMLVVEQNNQLVAKSISYSK